MYLARSNHMKKYQELTDPTSCMMSAGFNEMTFVILERDVAAPHTIREWVKQRLKLKKNLPGDTQIIEALECAKYIEDSLNRRNTPV